MSAFILCVLLFFILCPLICVIQSQDIQRIYQTHSSPLSRYTTYSDSVIMHFDIPENTIFASFVFVGLEEDLSIFGCNTRNVSVYLKYGALPLINPDDSPFPGELKNFSRSLLYHVEYLTDKSPKYINITSPEPGTYYAAAFLAYEDPRYDKISQQGLSQSCEAYTDVSVYVRKIESPTIVTENQLVDFIGLDSEVLYFKFLIPGGLDQVIISLDNISLSAANQTVFLRVDARKPPTSLSFQLEKTLNSNTSSLNLIVPVESHTWYFMSFEFQRSTELTFQLKYFSNLVPAGQSFVAQSLGNRTLYNISIESKNYVTQRLTDIHPYKQYSLLRESSTASYMFSLKLQPEIDNSGFLPINVTSNEFSVLKFHLQQGSDIGGSLHYILAFKPRLSRSRWSINLLEEPENHVVVGCIQRHHIAVPTWPNMCVSGNSSAFSLLILNHTTTNSTFLIPYPESGLWYASFKLFCGQCEPCNCSESCQQKYEACLIDCELNCSSKCGSCVGTCSAAVWAVSECKSCDCEGPCLRNRDNQCNSSIVFDVSSRPCYFGGCGTQGRCGLFISEGVAYSSCYCSNNYRGFDCSDDSLATPYYLVLLEFLLLILSNIFFLPVAYVAYKRGYYIEAVSYFAIFLSSSFYHACDAGENILSFCIFRLSALQFADFYSALLAIWLTLLAIADLPQIQLSLLQMTGSIIISFCVTLNRYALWIFALPSAVGVVIIGISWYLKYRKYRCRFLEKRYLYVKLPFGGAVVTLGLIIYGLLQTQNNYKYLHSLWHIIMASGVVLLLPKRDTFQDAVLL